MKEPISTKFGRLVGKGIKKSGKILVNITKGVAQEFKIGKNKNKK